MDKEKRFEIVIEHYDKSIENLEKLLEHKRAERFCLLVEQQSRQEGQKANQRVRVYGEFSNCPSFLIIVYKYQTVSVKNIKKGNKKYECFKFI